MEGYSRASQRHGWSACALQACLFLLLGVAGLQAQTDLFFSEYVEPAAPFANDKALEVFNPTSATISLNGYFISMYSNGATTAGINIALSGSIAPLSTYVVVQSGAVSPVVTGAANLTAGSGWFNGNDAVVLRKGTTFVDVIGQVGVDPGTAWGVAPTITINRTLRRKSSVVSGDPNGSDAFDPAAEWEAFAVNTFDGLGFHSISTTPTPSNSAAPDSYSVTRRGSNQASDVLSVPAPGVLANDVASAGVSGALSVVLVSGPSGAASFSLNADGSFTYSAAPGVTSDTFTYKAVAGSMESGVATVTITISGVALIDEVQGGHFRSPLVGSRVTVEGYVTAVRSNGFYVQEPPSTTDGSDATSSGILIFTGTGSNPAVAVGQKVAVTGTVTEFRPGGASGNNLATTEITDPTYSVVDSTTVDIDTTVPAVVIGCQPGERTPPYEQIYTAAGGATIDAETGPTFDIANDGLAFYESLEGMRVVIHRPVVVGPTNAFGETPVVASYVDASGNQVLCAPASRFTPRGGVIIGEFAGLYNPFRMFIDDTFASYLPDGADLKAGDVLADVTAIVDYSFGNFKFNALQTATLVSASTLQPTPPLSLKSMSGTSFTIVSINAENLDPSDPPSKFDKLVDTIVNSLGSPDIVGLVEVQDNNGAINDGTVDCTTTMNILLTKISAAGGPSYAFRVINPVNNADGGEPGGNIRQVFMYNPAVVTYVDRPGATATTANTVVDAGGVPQLAFSPGRIDPSNSAFTSSRKPLVNEVLINGKTVFVILNHLNSKGGDDPLFGRFQPPVRSSETQRSAQVALIKAFVEDIYALDPSARVVVQGDLNDFINSPTLAPLYAAAPSGLVNAYTLLPDPNTRYSYNFEGNCQALDHILVSPSLSNNNGVQAQAQVLHVNAEFPESAPSRFSDHDPVLVLLDVSLPPSPPSPPPPSPPPPSPPPPSPPPLSPCLKKNGKLDRKCKQQQNRGNKKEK